MLLGPVRVIISGRPLPIASNNQRAVLAMLLLEPGRAVPVSRLVDAVWDDDPPSTARNQVQLSVSQLRKRFAQAGHSGLVLTDPAGYLIADPGDALDLRLFQDLVRAADAAAAQRPAEAVAGYREALRLWRGEAAADVASRVVQQAAARLNESRLAAQEACLEQELRLGRHAQVVGELTELVARYPLRDRFRAQLMTALYRSGRQADALEAARTGREIMREELGLDPGPELRALEQAILVGDSALDPPDRPLARIAPAGPWEPDAADRLGPVPVPRQLPPAVAGFAGRQDLLAGIGRTLLPPDGADGGVDGGGADGPGGVRLVVLTGRGGTGKTALALQAAHAVRDAFPDGTLYAEFRDEPDPALNPARVLEGFLRAFGIAPAAVPEELSARAALYRSWLAGKRVLIVLDNVPDAVEAEPLLPGTPGCSVIITSRGRLARLPASARLEVGPLDAAAGARLVGWSIGADRAAAEPDAVAELVALCDGLPLALRIAGSKLAGRPHWTVEQLRARLADERRRLDELDLDGTSVRATLVFAYRSLPEELQRLLRRLSMLGVADFPSWVAGAIMEVALDAAEDMLAELVSAQMLEVRTAADGSVRYHMHDLVFLYMAEMLAREDTAPEHRAGLQRRAGYLLSLAERVHGLRVARGVKVARREVPRLPRQAPRVPDDARPADLTLRPLTDAGAARPPDGENGLAVAATWFSLGHATQVYGLDESAHYLRRALLMFEELGCRHGQGLVLRDLASADRRAGRYSDAKTRYTRALSCLEDVGDQAAQLSVLRNLARLEIERGDLDPAEDLLARAIELGGRIGDRRATMEGRYQLAELHRRQGAADRAGGLLRSVLADTRQAGDLVGQAYCLLGLGRLLADQGELDRAVDELRAAAQLAERAENVTVRGETLLALAEAEYAAERLDMAAECVAKALDLFGRLGSALWRARFLELSGRLHERKGRLDEAVLLWKESAELAGDADAALTRRLEAALHALTAASG